MWYLEQEACMQTRNQRLEAHCRELEEQLAERTNALTVLQEAERRRADQFRVITEVSQRITSTLELNQVMGQVARLIQQVFGYYHVGIGLVEGMRSFTGLAPVLYGMIPSSSSGPPG